MSSQDISSTDSELMGTKSTGKCDLNCLRCVSCTNLHRNLICLVLTVLLYPTVCTNETARKTENKKKREMKEITFPSLVDDDI